MNSAPFSRAIAPISFGLRLDHAEIGGILDVHRRGLGGDLRLQVCEIEQTRLRIEGDQLDIDQRLGDRARVVPRHRQHFGIHRLRQQHLLAAGQTGGHAKGGRRSLATVVLGKPEEVHVEQLPHHARVLEPRLPLAVVGPEEARIGGEKLSPAVDLVAYRRHEMLRTAGTQETQVIGAVAVPIQQPLQVPLDRVLVPDRFGQIHSSLEAEPIGDLLVELHDVVDPDLLHHLLLDPRSRVRRVRIHGIAAHS